MKLNLTDWLGDRTFLKSMLRLALPIATQNLLASSMAIIDTIMVGSLGEAPLAAVALAGQWIFLMNLLLFGLSSGATVFVSQYWGIQDVGHIRKAYGMALINSLAVAVIFSAVAISAPQRVIALYTDDPQLIVLGAKYLRITGFGYGAMAVNNVIGMVLRSTEEVRLPFFTSLIATLTNTFFNWVLIFGKFGLPAMGVEGAAITTAFSALLSSVLLITISVARNNMARAPIGELLRLDRAFVKRFYVVAAPVICNEGFWAVGINIVNAVLGRLGTANYSAYTIAGNVQNLVFVFFVGMCSACSVMVGKSVGAGEFDTGYRDARRFGTLIPLAAIVLGATLIALRDPLLSLYQLSAEGYATARVLLLMYACILPLSMFNYVIICGIYRAGGDTRTGLYLDMGSMFLITVPLVALAGMVFRWPFPVVYAMTFMENIPKAILGMKHLISGRWIKPVTQTAVPEMVL
jgi:putative MATE family efflux protein